MKTRILVALFAIAAFFFSGCREINVSTIVNKDGSFTRIINVTADSSEAFKKELPCPVDTTWTMVWKKDSASKEKFTVTYTKKFAGAEELNTENSRDTSWYRQLPRTLEIRKRYGFFYSYIEYRELYRAANPFTQLPWKAWVPAGDYLWVTRRHPVSSPADSLKRKDAEEKVLAFLIESAAAEFEQITAAGLNRLNDPALRNLKTADYHEKIKSLIRNDNAVDEAIMGDSLARWSGIAAAVRLRELHPALYAGFNRKVALLGNILAMEEFSVSAEMPGLITASNSALLSGNRVSWNLFPMQFLLEDYPMTVESRVINVWAFVLTGLVVLGLISLLAVKTLKGRNALPAPDEPARHNG